MILAQVIVKLIPAHDPLPIVISSIGIAIAFLSLIWSIVSSKQNRRQWEQSGPVVRVQGTRVVCPEPIGWCIAVKAVNLGRAPITVNSVGWELPSGETIVWCDLLGPALPHRLEPAADEQWLYNVPLIAAGLAKRGDAGVPLVAVASLATGERTCAPTPLVPDEWVRW